MTIVHSHAGPSALMERDDMLAALSIIIGAVEKHATIPILSNVRMSKTPDIDRCITLTATNLDMQVSVNVRANVSDEFATTIPAHALRDVLRKLPETERNRLSLEMLEAPIRSLPVIDPDTGEHMTDERDNLLYEDERRNSFVSDRLSVRLGRANFEINSLPVDDFPEVAGFSSEPVEIVLPGSAFWNAIDAVKDAISTEETRYYLNGAFLHVVDRDTLALTATDGHRLYRQEIHDVDGIKALPNVILPAASLHLMHGLLKGKNCPSTVEVMVAEGKYAVMWGPVTLLSKTVDGTFPDYARVIPTATDKLATVRASRLAGAVAAVTAIRSKNAGAVKLVFQRGVLTISIKEVDVGGGSMEVDCQYDGERIEIGFSSSYLLDALTAAAPDGRDVTIAMSDGMSPALITGSIAGWKGVLMPHRI
ncbi:MULTISPECIES: DNA polymerase III subunit beta [Phyllobacteriaceae]|nr:MULTISPECIES: DNA polymerase III subunit beta [Mesorhizobium]